VNDFFNGSYAPARNKKPSLGSAAFKYAEIIANTLALI
jgi:hypothetical protein